MTTVLDCYALAVGWRMGSASHFRSFQDRTKDLPAVLVQQSDQGHGVAVGVMGA
jgi:hypothetical protein